MKKSVSLITPLLLFALFACNKTPKTDILDTQKSEETPFIWEGANLYFLLTDRFNNGDKDNDIQYNRNEATGVLRGFEGGDIRGIIQKIDDNYFSDLGINAIWFTPVVEQIHGIVDEGTGNTYGYHGYWAKDWTNLDASFGTKKDLKELVEKAHKKGIRIVLDAVINHTGPVTKSDPVWPDNWVRTGPQCDYKTFETTTACTLVKNLPDVLTESDAPVELPAHLVTKWKEEGRYEQEIAELDAFFKRTGYPRAPRFYIIKWLTDYITEFGIDAYRADTVKHTEASVWAEFKVECDYAFAEWKKNNKELVLDDNDFFLLAEVYNYNISHAKAFDFGDKKINYFDYGFDAMINFEFKYNAKSDYEDIFSRYSDILNGEIKGKTVVNYLTSHDDGGPFDKERTKSIESANKLLLSPGISQVYYGDETARSLIIEGTVGDATLRSNMNWEQINSDKATQEILSHWQKLGQFRNNHPAIGTGVHQMISKSPYIFSRTLKRGSFEDTVIVGLDLAKGAKEINVSGIFKDGDTLIDQYSGMEVKVSNGKADLNSEYQYILLELK
ncbi:MAG: alpha-amylase family glycosyl hydrolase [Flavobacteriaceae bacterium]|nr:alpha-amylase family glycosyl hydrolase [Flavobacteriaceae bacterium]